MSLQGVLPFVLDFLPQKPIEIEVSQAQLTGDAGLLPIRQFDEAIRLTERFAEALGDARCGDVVHPNLSMVRQRIDGILASYEDQNDHDALRSDPAFKLVCDRSPKDHDLASQPTLSRFENAVTIADLKRLRDCRTGGSGGTQIRRIDQLDQMVGLTGSRSCLKVVA